MNYAVEQQWRAECEKELLHLTSAIQSFGALIFVQQDTFLITHASANIDSFFPKSLGLNLRLGTIFEELQSINCVFLSSIKLHEKFNFHCYVDQLVNPIAVSIIALEKGWIIEFERDSPINIPSVASTYSDIKETVKIDTLNQHLVDGIKSLTGFDRVMIYKFDEEWNGQVIAESANVNLGSYLDLHFPASDIPAIARKLYQSTPWRYIANANQPNIPIVGIDHAEPIDLTLSELRSVSPMHIQYLLNMKVESSFSVAINLSNKLWGLVICHNLRATHLPRTVRSSCVDLVAKFRLSLSEHITRDSMARLDHTHRFIRDFCEGLPIHWNSHELVQMLFEYFSNYLQLSGVALVCDQEALLAGITIPDEAIQAIDGFFCKQPQALWQTHCSRDLIPGHPCIGVLTAGIVAIRLTVKRMPYNIFFFRAEKADNIRWAGNPNKPQEIISEGRLHISPRNSFEIWVENERGKSLPWSKADIAMISHLQMSLLKHLR